MTSLLVLGVKSSIFSLPNIRFAFLRKLAYSAFMPITAHDYRTPGQLIRALLEERSWSIRTLAIVLQVGETSMSRVVADKQPVTVEMALAMSDVFGVPAERFLELQQSYDLAKARIASIPNPGLETRARLFGGLPVAEMIKRGWLKADDMKDVPKVEMALAKFFGVTSPQEIEILPHAAKKTHVNVPTSPAQLAWLYRVREIAADMLAGRYSPHSVQAAIPKLKALLGAPEEARKVPRILAECGIRFVIVETLPTANIDGVCFWLNDASPVIGMSLRHDRIDNFWFVLRHELEHVIQLHGRAAAMVDAELEGDRAGVGIGISEEERIANRVAADFCVPTDQIDGFIRRKAPFFPERDVLGFARTLGVHPGLIAGQLQHRTKRFELFRSHLVKIRQFVLPGAMSDGWGNVAPIGN
jgi:HTH-type transcriptional regulator/antitoxin HigA